VPTTEAKTFITVGERLEGFSDFAGWIDGENGSEFLWPWMSNLSRNSDESIDQSP